MKPLEILSSVPPWAAAAPEQVVDSPAFAMPCQIGDKAGVLRRAQIDPAESAMLVLSIAFGDEPHELCIARSPSFPELDKIWDSRADVPDALLLALVERECGPLLQFLENAVRRQLRLCGVAAEGERLPGREMLAFQVEDIVFSVTRSDAVLSAFGILRNLDISHEAIREQTLPSETEYASFVMPEADISSLAPGDAVLLPEMGSVPPRLVVAGRFAVDSNGVSAYETADLLVRVRAAQGRDVSLGEVLDSVGTPSLPPAAEVGEQLSLVRDSGPVAFGRLDRLAGQLAFVVESAT